MNNETTTRNKVIDYLKRLRFSETEIQIDIESDKGKTVDAIVFNENNNAIIVVELKKDNINLPKENDKTLRFNPLVRQLQLVADRFKAPYYLISDGAVFMWFKTDDTGLPLLINEPSSREELIDSSEEEQEAERLTSLFDDLKRFLFWKGGNARTEEAAFLVLSKLRSDRGDATLRNYLLESQTDYNQLSLFGSQQPVDQQFSDYLLGLIKHNKNNNHLANAFHMLDQVNLRSIDPQVVLKAIDSAFLNAQVTKEKSKIYRWLADFMVRLADPRNEKTVLDISSNTGEILAATKMYSEDCFVYGATDQQLSALWGQIQQEILVNSRMLKILCK